MVREGFYVTTRDLSDMTICNAFRNTRLPYLLVPFFSTAITAVSWMSMSAAGLPASSVQLIAATTFLVTSALATAYFVRCLGRYAPQAQQQ